MSCACKHLCWTSDLTSQYSVIIFEILELILHSFNVNHIHIFRILYFLVLLYIFLRFHSYRELVTIILQLSKHVFNIITTYDQINLGKMIECFYRLSTADEKLLNYTYTWARLVIVQLTILPSVSNVISRGLRH